MMIGNYYGLSNWNFLMIPLAIWGAVWKGFALWRAAKRDSKPWFIALLVINTMGILEILYLFVFGKEKAKTASKKSRK